MPFLDAASFNYRIDYFVENHYYKNNKIEANFLAMFSSCAICAVLIYSKGFSYLSQSEPLSYDKYNFTFPIKSKYLFIISNSLFFHTNFPLLCLFYY